jgi:hypothetical protein
VAKAARNKKKADMAKRQPYGKETKTYTAAVATIKASAAAAAAWDYSTCYVSLHGFHRPPTSLVFDQEFVPHTPASQPVNEYRRRAQYPELANGNCTACKKKNQDIY